MTDRSSASPLARKNSLRANSMSNSDTEVTPSSSRDADIEKQALMERRSSKSMRAAKAVAQAPKQVCFMAVSTYHAVCMT